jgi:nitrous oxidase accessory protein NosD
LPGVRSILAAAALAATTASWAADVRVPQDYSTIQRAIDAAPPGARIVVARGTYYENLVIDKSITLVSRSGSALTTLDGGRLGPVIFARGTDAESVEISGFAIVNGLNLFTTNVPGAGAGGGIHVESLAGATISDNVIRDNVGCLGVGISALDATVGIEHNQVLNNQQDSSCNGGDGGGIIVRAGGPAPSLIASNLIAGHTIGGYGAGIEIQRANTVIRDNVVRDNAANAGGAIAFDVSSGIVSNNLLIGNSAEVGGGMWLTPTDNGNHLVVTGNMLVGNRASLGGSAVDLVVTDDGLRMRGNVVDGDTAVDLIRCETPFSVSRSNILHNQSGPTIGGACTFGLIF